MSRDALVVGVNSYSKLNPLQAPAEDAEAIAQLLTKAGEFQVRRLPEIVENDAPRVGRKAEITLEELENALVQLFLPQGKHVPDIALFYFSGHGLRKERGIQEGYLALSDSNPEVGFYGLSLSWLRRLLEASTVRQQVVWLDCCNSGELLNFNEADPGDRGKGRDRCFIAASREFEVAYEEIGDRYSVLTKALLQGLDPSRHAARWVTNYSLVDVLNRQLQSATQRPVFANSGEPINLTRRWEAAIAVPVAALPEAICPYKGLAYFDCNEEDPKYFYGRNALTDQLLNRIRQANFLAIVGPSGSGKSSVLRAGLLHQLKLGRRLSGSDRWQIRIMQPGEHPLQNLAAAFLDLELSAIDRADQLHKAEQQIAEGAAGLWRLVGSTDRVVLVIDQFEEAFTLCQGTPSHERERQQFFQCLLEALPQTDRLCLILAMRADFFGKCLEQDYSGLARQIQDHLVTVMPMSREELRQAIEQPAQQVNLAIEPELVTQMLTDVEGSPGSLPLLQYTLTELWKQRTEECLRLKTYTQLGGVMGTLQKRATEVYESFSTEQQAIVQHIFLALTQLGEGTEDTRRRVRKADLVPSRYMEGAIDLIVQKLADEKLIVTGDRLVGTERVAVVDVAHEALIRHWSLLRKWLDENRDKLRQKRKIEAAAEEWETHRKSKDYLLQGKALTKARAFQKEQANNLTLSNLTDKFIKISLRQRRFSRMTIAGIVAIPILITFTAAVPALRQAKYNQARTVIESRGVGTREALENLTEGCQEKITLSWLPVAVTEFLFGDCASLSGADLSETSLIDANLSSADLRDVGLGEADLSGADLSNANLSNVYLSNVYLSNANLIDANLSNANLSGADLSNADLIDANLRGAQNLTPEQVKVARNWEQAIYNKEFCQQLGLKECRTEP
jgi:uncharacterized protein YjbI with pentapeptide repeats/energy-coupling factor transporter ATP-binding protein EcfA2